MIYKIFSFSMILSFAYAAFNGNLSECVKAVIGGVGGAVSLTLTLAGMMCFWSGMISVIKDSKILSALSGALSPITEFLFPASRNNSSLKRDISLFICANALGLGNAATPIALGIMKSADDGKERVNDETVMLCLIATAPVSLVPTTVMSIIAGGGVGDPLSVIPYVWICSTLSFAFAVTVGKIYCALRKKR